MVARQSHQDRQTVSQSSKHIWWYVSQSSVPSYKHWQTARDPVSRTSIASTTEAQSIQQKGCTCSQGRRGAGCQTNCTTHTGAQLEHRCAVLLTTLCKPRRCHSVARHSCASKQPQKARYGEHHPHATSTTLLRRRCVCARICAHVAGACRATRGRRRCPAPAASRSAAAPG